MTQTRVLLFSLVETDLLAVRFFNELSVFLNLFGWKGHVSTVTAPSPVAQGDKWENGVEELLHVPVEHR
jgi:hypothetical protein